MYHNELDIFVKHKHIRPPKKLEQLERLRSENTPTPTPHRPIITYTIGQFIWDPK